MRHFHSRALYYHRSIGPDRCPMHIAIPLPSISPRSNICCGRTSVLVHWVHDILGRITASVPRGNKYVHAKMGLVDTAHRYVPPPASEFNALTHAFTDTAAGTDVTDTGSGIASWFRSGLSAYVPLRSVERTNEEEAYISLSHWDRYVNQYDRLHPTFLAFLDSSHAWSVVLSVSYSLSCLYSHPSFWHDPTNSRLPLRWGVFSL